MKKSIWIGIGIVGFIVLLAGAAFLGSRLLAPVLNPNGLGNLPIGPSAGGAVPARMGIELNITPAEEIPTRAPEFTGQISEIKNNSLLIRPVVGGVSMALAEGQEGQEGQAEPPSPELGPATEIVVTQETQVYQETTFDDRISDKEIPGNGEAIQQTVKGISLSDLDPKQHVRVWGYKRGDRIVAEIILTSQMVTFSH